MLPEQNDLAAQNATLLAEQRAVADLGLLALSERSLPVLLQEAATLVRGALQTDFSKVLQLEPDEQLLVVAGSGWPDGVVGHLELPSSGGSPAAFALRTRTPAIVTDLLNETRFTPERALLDLGVRSSVNVIIEGVKQPFGVLEVDGRAPRAYNSDEVAFLQLVANILSGALERQAADEERERFVSLAAHELRTPVTSVLGFSRRLLQRGIAGSAFDEAAIDELRTLYSSARRLEHTVRQLSQLAQLGHLVPFEREPVNLTRLVGDVLRDMADRYPRVELRAVDSDGEVVVDADATLVEGAVRNLVDNAAKYSPPGGHVAVAVDLQGERAAVRVRDTCGGLGETKVSRLFEPYHRGTPPQRVSGLGLGLYLVKEIAAALAGEVSVKDIPGEGCEFALELPLSAAPDV